jgi:hypothetical protein
VNFACFTVSWEVLLAEFSRNEDQGRTRVRFSSRNEHLAILFDSPESADIAAKWLEVQWRGSGLYVFWI